MECVDHEFDSRMVHRLHDLPRMAELVDLPAPGKRLVADAEAAPRCALAERAKILGRDAVIGKRVRRGVAAHEHQVGAELLHHVELAFGAIEILRHAAARRGLEVAEGLKQQHAQTEVGADGPHLGGRAVEIQKIVLEDLDAVEARSRDRLQLFDQSSAKRYCGNGAEHSSYPIKLSS